MNVRPLITAGKFVPMAAVSTEIPDTFASAIPVSFLHKIKKLVSTPGKVIATKKTRQVAGIR